MLGDAVVGQTCVQDRAEDTLSAAQSTHFDVWCCGLRWSEVQQELIDCGIQAKDALDDRDIKIACTRDRCPQNTPTLNLQEFPDDSAASS